MSKKLTLYTVVGIIATLSVGSAIFFLRDRTQNYTNNRESSTNTNPNPNPVEEKLKTEPSLTKPDLDQTQTQSKKYFIPDKLKYDALGIESPIIYAKLNDVFQQDQNGITDTNKPILEDASQGPLSTPIQRLLSKGIVHLPFTPNPGELGNSYIVGHSSNYASVKSDYNYIFKNLNKAKIGDEFYLLESKNNEKIKLRIFEIEEIDGKDVEKAYKKFPDRKVVTLQASILVDGAPLKRLLVRGETI